MTAGPSDDRGSSEGDSGGNSPSPSVQRKATPKKTSESTLSGQIVHFELISYGAVKVQDGYNG